MTSYAPTEFPVPGGFVRAYFTVPTTNANSLIEMTAKTTYWHPTITTAELDEAILTAVVAFRNSLAATFPGETWISMAEFSTSVSVEIP